MSAVRELAAALVAGGMDAIDAASLIARAGAELVTPKKSAGAERQQRYRERNKPSQNVTPLRPVEASPTVTNRNESVTSDNASLSLTTSENNNKKESKRESRASQLPDGWRPSDELWQSAVHALGSPLRAEQELTKFKNHAADKGRVSKRWGAAWANWVDRAIVYAAGSSGTNAKRTVHDAGRDQSARLRALDEPAPSLRDGPGEYPVRLLSSR